MDYFNWQKIHKNALTAQAKRPRQIPPENLPIEVVRVRAWAALQQSCSNQQLEMLQKLAAEFESGERLHDTFYI